MRSEGEADPPPGLLKRAVGRLSRRRSAGSALPRVAPVIGAAAVATAAVVVLSVSMPAPSGQRSGTAVAEARESQISPSTSESVDPTIAATLFSPSADPSSRVEPSSTDEASPTPEPTTSPEPTPTIGPLSDDPQAILERSDTFWDAVTGGDYANRYHTLREMTNASDLVVVGRFSEIWFGDEVNGFPVSRATVLVDEVLKGTPKTQVPGTFVQQLLPVSGSQEGAVRDTLPSHQHLFFLWFAPSEMERQGEVPREDDPERYDYYMLNGDQAVLRSIGDVTRVLMPSNLEVFPGELDGAPFDEVVDQVRAFANP